MLEAQWQTLTREVRGQSPAPVVAAAEDLDVLMFEGDDALGFLQGYFTCNLDALQDGEFHLTAMTNIKGRVVANGWCRCMPGDSVQWVLHSTLTEKVQSFMRPYLQFSRTTLTRPEGDRLILGRTIDPVPLVIESSADLERLLETHRPGVPDDFRGALIDNRLAVVSETTSEQFLPQMLGLVDLGAVNFDKGCYLGQEVVARAQHRGEVKRRLHRLRSDVAGARLPASSPVADGSGREAGVLVSDLVDDAAGSRCLAVLREPPDGTYRCDSLELALDD